MDVSVVDLTTRPVDLIYKSLTPSVAPYMIEPEIVEKKCSCCERPVSEFGRQGYTFKNSYSQHVVHFVQCYSFCVSAPDIMGIDAPSKLKSSQKFDLWRGVGAGINVATLNAVLYVTTCMVRKLPVVFFDKVNAITATMAQQTDYIFTADLQYLFICNRVFGRKTYELIRSLRVSYSGNVVYAWCDTLMTRMNEVDFRINLNQKFSENIKYKFN